MPGEHIDGDVGGSYRTAINGEAFGHCTGIGSMIGNKGNSYTGIAITQAVRRMLYDATGFPLEYYGA